MCSVPCGIQVYSSVGSNSVLRVTSIDEISHNIETLFSTPDSGSKWVTPYLPMQVSEWQTGQEKRCEHNIINKIDDALID